MIFNFRKPSNRQARLSPAPGLNSCTYFHYKPIFAFEFEFFEFEIDLIQDN